MVTINNFEGSGHGENVGFSSEWEIRYKAGTHRSIWPWSDLVRLCERYVRPRLRLPAEPLVLEIGCGFGANIPYLLTLGQYFGIDGSSTVLDDNLVRFPELKGRLKTVDFTHDLGFQSKFDVICDRASITHNSDKQIRNCIGLVRDSLNVGGLFVGVVWFSKAHSDYLKPVVRVDDHTITGFTQGQFDGVGLVHFTDEQNIRDIFVDFDIIYLEHRVSNVIIPGNGSLNAFYNLVAIRHS